MKKKWLRIKKQGDNFVLKHCDVGAEGNITIPDGVARIGDYAFYHCYKLTSITIPESVTHIGDHAFDGCSGLTAITIPESVTYIGNHAFEGCSGLTSITIPESVTDIGYCVFYGCSRLTSITIPEGVTHIGEYAFYGCSSLTSITIPKSSVICYIAGNAFCCCSGLTSICVEAGNPVYDSRENCNAIVESETNALIAGCKNTNIPDGVTIIRDYAFSGQFSLTSITIPNGVTSIGERAFEGCCGLTSICVEEGNMVYDSREDCNAIIESKTNILIAGCQNTHIPEGVTVIGNHAFQGCSDLTSITFPKSVFQIGAESFSDCKSLKYIAIPEGVVSIGDFAFKGCINLKYTTIPKSVTSIGEGAFDDCPIKVPVKEADDKKADDLINKSSLVDIFVFLSGLTSLLLVAYLLVPYWVNRFSGNWEGFSTEYKLFSCWLRGTASNPSGKWGIMILAWGIGILTLRMVYHFYSYNDNFFGKRNSVACKRGEQLATFSILVVYILLLVFVFPSLSFIENWVDIVGVSITVGCFLFGLTLTLLHGNNDMD